MDPFNLNAFAERHHIETKALQGFWEYMNNWKKEHPDNFSDKFNGDIDASNIELLVHSYQLTHILDCGDFVYCNVAFSMLGFSLGYYRLVFTLDGEVADDILHFNSDFDYMIQRATWMLSYVTEGLENGISIDVLISIFEVEAEQLIPIKTKIQSKLVNSKFAKTESPQKPTPHFPVSSST